MFVGQLDHGSRHDVAIDGLGGLLRSLLVLKRVQQRAEVHLFFVRCVLCMSSRGGRRRGYRRRLRLGCMDISRSCGRNSRVVVAFVRGVSLRRGGLVGFQGCRIQGFALGDFGIEDIDHGAEWLQTRGGATFVRFRRRSESTGLARSPRCCVLPESPIGRSIAAVHNFEDSLPRTMTEPVWETRSGGANHPD